MKPMVLFGVVLISGALAADTALKLSINGKTSPVKAITVNGKVFVPLEALESAGVKISRSSGALALTLPGATPGSPASSSTPSTVVGGANERPSLEGCLGEYLFNGVWRIRASNLERVNKDENTPGWGLTLEVRNGSKATIAPVDAGRWATEGIQLAFADASTISSEGYEVQKLQFASLPAGGMVKQQLKFYYPFGTKEDQVKTPIKFLLELDAKFIAASTKAKGVRFTVPNPSLRVRLDCQK
jgi:hypothetical protein